MQRNTRRTISAEKAKKVSSFESKSILQLALEGCCTVLLCGIVVLLTAQMVVRHLGWGALLWSSEMATWLFSWSAFFGAVLVFMEKKHIIIDILTFIDMSYQNKIMNQLAYFWMDNSKA